jgi:hypothetical protein
MTLDSQSSSKQSGSKELDKEDIINLLGEEDDKVTEKEEVVKEEEPKEEETEEEEKLELSEETEEEEKEEITEELELTVPARKKEILAKYPKLFKEFPYLEKAYYKEQQYAELGLATLDDAKEIVEKGRILDNFEADLMKGNTETILKSIKETNPEAFNTVADNYLQALGKVDKDAYFTVIGNLMKHTIIGMINEGKRLGEEKGSVLQETAAVLNQYLFGTSEFEPPKKLAKEKEADSESEKLKREREDFDKSRLDTAKSDVSSRFDGVLKNTIADNIDKNDSMPPYVKRNAIREVQELVKESLAGDKAFSSMIDRLYKSASEDKYSRTSLDKVLSAYRTRARVLLPSIISKVRNEALKGLGKTSSTESNQGHLPVKRTTTSSSKSGIKSAKDIPKSMSTLEFLNSD